MERKFLAFVSHDVAMYLVERCEDGCKVIIHESPCSSCQERTGWYESEEEWFCQGMYGTFRCSDCHLLEEE